MKAMTGLETNTLLERRFLARQPERPNQPLGPVTL